MGFCSLLLFVECLKGSETLISVCATVGRVCKAAKLHACVLKEVVGKNEKVKLNEKKLPDVGNSVYTNSVSSLKISAAIVFVFNYVVVMRL